MVKHEEQKMSVIDETYFATDEYKNLSKAERITATILFHSGENLKEIDRLKAKYAGYSEYGPMREIISEQISRCREMQKTFIDYLSK